MLAENLTPFQPQRQMAKHDPLLDLPYRIARLPPEQGVYLTKDGWGMKSEATIFTAADRLFFTLPEHGCWELVERETPKFGRQQVAKRIAEMLFAQSLREEGQPPMILADAPRADADPFLRAGELIVQLALNPDLERTAIFAAAYALDEHLFQMTDTSQAVLFTTMRQAIRAYQHTLMHTSNQEDDRRLDERLAVLEHKGLVGEEVNR